MLVSVWWLFQYVTAQGILLGKTSLSAETDAGVATHFAAFNNSLLVGVFAGAIVAEQSVTATGDY